MMNATTLQRGTPLKFKFDGGIVEGTYVRPSENPEYGVFSHNGREVNRSYARVANLNPDWTPATFAPTSVTSPVIQATGPDGPVNLPAVIAQPEQTFDVNTRFMFIERMVDMVVRNQEKSLMVTGSGGLGKSYTIFNRLKLNDLGEADFEKVSGHMTPKALYRRLHEANDKIVVFDDCDSVLVNDTSVNLIKAALDSYGRRTLNWASELGSRESELPSSFDFTGRIIFISNFSLIDIPQPVVSRALYVDVTMTADEKIERITAIAPSLCPDMNATEREECIELLSKNRHRISDLNLRTMLKVANIRRANPQHWRDMATYMVTAKLNRAGR
jgi:hypothetical protein